MNLQNIKNLRRDLIKFYNAALQAVDARVAVKQFLSSHRVAPGKWYVCAIGKAAPVMAQGAYDVLGSSIEQGLIITKQGHAELWRDCPDIFSIHESGHPLPDARSLTAGSALIHFIEHIPADGRVLMLLSGGASALVEVLPDDIELDDLQKLNAWLLSHGVDIATMNLIRKKISCIKGGRLAKWIFPRSVLQLIISDVPKDQLSDIGSGLLVAQTGKLSQEILTALPSNLKNLLQNTLGEPDIEQKFFEKIESHIVANNTRACNAAIAAGQIAGYRLRTFEQISGDVTVVSRLILEHVVSGEPGLYVYGGETVVTLPESPGTGGRCQHLALLFARDIADKKNLAILVCSTDGTDGPTTNAGAIVDGDTVARGEVAGLSISHYLHCADAGTYLEATGDLIDTGPTGTNVMDIVIVLKSAD